MVQYTYDTSAGSLFGSQSTVLYSSSPVTRDSVIILASLCFPLLGWRPLFSTAVSLFPLSPLFSHTFSLPYKSEGTLSEHCHCAFQVSSPPPYNFHPRSTFALPRRARHHFFLFDFLLISPGEFHLFDAWRLVISIIPSSWCAFTHAFP